MPPPPRVHEVWARITEPDHPMCGEPVLIRWTDDLRGRPIVAAHVNYGGRLVSLADIEKVLASTSPKTEGEETTCRN